MLREEDRESHCCRVTHMVRQQPGLAGPKTRTQWKAFKRRLETHAGNKYNQLQLECLSLGHQSRHLQPDSTLILHHFSLDSSLSEVNNSVRNILH